MVNSLTPTPPPSRILFSGYEHGPNQYTIFYNIWSKQLQTLVSIFLYLKFPLKAILTMKILKIENHLFKIGLTIENLENRQDKWKQLMLF